jgi:hypothetical protein
VPRLTQVSASSPLAFVYVAITLFGWPFQAASTNQWIGNSTVADPTTPSPAREAPHHSLAVVALMRPVQRWVWAVPISLAATLGIAIAFSSSRY